MLTYQSVIEAGRTLEIDTEARTVFLDGNESASRRSLVVGTWPELLPGTSDVGFRAADNDAAGTLTVEWRSAWW